LDAFYGKTGIVSGAALSIDEGEIVGLLGRNGAGKTTLLKALVGLARIIQCAPTARFTSGGRIHPGSCW
jgi:ABC-type multidrug transport system ATPase subunit